MRLGPYTLDQELGRGASGVVYRGRSPKGQAVALKLLATQSPEVLDRFSREARLHGQLGAEAGFVPFLDMGLAEGRPYLVMPLLRGGTLRDRLERGPLSVRGAIELGERLGGALGRAHALGIVHRDVKPENVLFDAGGNAFLADLGMAKHFRHDLSGASQSVVLSRAGEVRGTVAYMPPEQLQDASGAGPPADVFALGAVLYECLSGEPPFSAETEVELLVQIASALHVPLRKRCECPPWLARLVEDCLAADPGQRPSEGLALAARLREGPRVEAERGQRARRLASAIFGVSLIGSGIAGGVLLQGQGPAPASPSPSLAASPTPSPEPSAAATPDPFPASWRALRRGKLLELERAWRPVGVSRAGQVAISPEEGLMVVGEASVFALGEGPPRPLVGSLPPLRRSTSFAADETLFVVQEGERIRIYKLADGALRSEAKTRPEGRLATLGFGGSSVVVAHGRRLARYKSLPRGKGTENLDFATLLETPRVMAAASHEVLVSQGTRVAFLDHRGSVRLLRDYEAPVAALAHRRGERPLALIATRTGELHWHDEKQVRVPAVQTGLEPLQALAAGRRHAALASETAIALVDLETREVVDRLDMSELQTEVVGLALSPDEDALAVGTEDGQVLRYALAAKEPAPWIEPAGAWGELRGVHASAVSQALAGEGLLLSADRTGAIHAWDPGSGERLRTIRSSQRAPGFALGASGRLWAIDLGRLRQWDVAKGHELRRLSLEESVYQISLRADEEELAAVAISGEVLVWSLATGVRRLAQKLPLEGQLPRRVALLPDGSLLLGYPHGKLALHDAHGFQVWTREAGSKEVRFLRALGEDQVLAGCADGALTIWSVRGGGKVRELKGSPMSSLSIRGERLLLGASTGELELWDLASGRRLWRRQAEVGIQVMASFGPGGEILVGGTERRLRLLDAEGSEPRFVDRWPPSGPPEVVLGFGFSARGQLVTVGQTRARSYEVETGRQISERSIGRARDARVGWTRFLTAGSGPDPGRPAAGLYVWEGEGPPQLLSRTIPPRFALSADGRVAVYTAARGVAVKNLETGAESFMATGSSPADLRVSAQGVYMLGAAGGKLELWSLATQRRLASPQSLGALPSFLPGPAPRLIEAQFYGRVRVLNPLQGPAQDPVLGDFTPHVRARPVLIEPDPTGERVALSFGDGRLELWEVPGGKRAAHLRLPDLQDPAVALAFSPKGQRLAVLTGRGRRVVYSVPK